MINTELGLLMINAACQGFTYGAQLLGAAAVRKSPTRSQVLHRRMLPVAAGLGAEMATFQQRAEQRR